MGDMIIKLAGTTIKFEGGVSSVLDLSGDHLEGGFWISSDLLDCWVTLFRYFCVRVTFVWCIISVAILLAAVLNKPLVCMRNTSFGIRGYGIILILRHLPAKILLWKGIKGSCVLAYGLL